MAFWVAGRLKYRLLVFGLLKWVCVGVTHSGAGLAAAL